MNDQKERFTPLPADAGPRDLEDALRRLHKAVETMQLGVTITDITGKIVYTNSADARMHGYAVEELIGQDVSVFCMPGYRRSLSPKQLRSMKSWRRESMNVRKDGTLVPVALMSDVVLDAHDEPIGIVTTCEDLTEAKLAEAERERLQVQIQQSRKLESLAALAGGVAQDYDSLLAVVLTNAGRIADELRQEGSSVRETVAEIQSAAMRMSDLNKQLLAYSGQGERKTTTVSLNDVVKDLVHFIEVSTPDDVTLRYDLGEDPPAITADPMQLQQVVRHLVTNASEAIGSDGGVITIRTGKKWLDRDYLATTFLGDDAPQGDYVFLEVVDTGVGMDPNTKARIFDPFFTTKYTGRGLGLAAVIGIVRSHHGVIRMDSATHQGTCITTFFPEDNPASD